MTEFEPILKQSRGILEPDNPLETPQLCWFSIIVLAGKSNFSYFEPSSHVWTLLYGKNDFYVLMAAAQAAEKHGNELDLICYVWWGVHTSVPTWNNSPNSLGAVEALSLGQT